MKTDTVGRRLRSKPTPTGKSLKITENDLRIFTALERHGILPSSILHHFHGAPNYVNTKVRLTQLAHEKPEGLSSQTLIRPSQQENTKYYLSNFMFYQLSPVGRAVLASEGLSEEPIRPTGGFAHMMMISAVTASIELRAREAGIEYIPGHVILERSGATLGWDKKLTPDQLFALKYPGGQYVAYMLECDRGTEQVSFSNNRKTYEGNYRHYKDFVGSGLYKSHYGLKCPMRVLNVMNSGARMVSYMNLITSCPYMLFQTVDGFGTSFRSPKYMPQLLSGEWLRSGYEGMSIIK